MSKGKALDELTKQRIIYLWMNHNCTQLEVAKRLGIGKTSVSRIIQEYTATGAHEPPEHMEIPKLVKKTQINPEFDAAVDAMIAESKSADAEEPAAIAEPDKLPPVVRRAIDDQISEYEFQISERDSRIEELKEEIAEFRKDIDALREWKEQHT